MFSIGSKTISSSEDTRNRVFLIEITNSLLKNVTNGNNWQKNYPCCTDSKSGNSYRKIYRFAEGIHSSADSANQLLLLLGTQRAKREPSSKHPFGYGRERYFWSFVVALILFSLGSLFAIYEGIERIRHPHTLDKANWNFAFRNIH